MKGKNHLIAGACTAACLTASAIIEHKVSIIPIAGMAAAACLGSLFPDIDSRTSKLGKKMKITSWLCSKVFGHRGFLHSPLFVALVYIVCWIIFSANDIMEYNYIWGGFIAGMLMHLMCDMTTKGGIPVLYPWSRGKFSIGVLPSGSKWEFVSLFFIIGLTCLITAVMIWNGWHLSMLLP